MNYGLYNLLGLRAGSRDLWLDLHTVGVDGGLASLTLWRRGGGGGGGAGSGSGAAAALNGWSGRGVLLGAALGWARLLAVVVIVIVVVLFLLLDAEDSRCDEVVDDGGVVLGDESDATLVAVVAEVDLRDSPVARHVGAVVLDQLLFSENQHKTCFSTYQEELEFDVEEFVIQFSMHDAAAKW